MTGKSKVTTHIAFLTAVVIGLGVLPGAAKGNVIFEDTMYWMPDGSTQINPSTPPTTAFVKIQETVFDDVQGKALIQQQLNANAIHGGPMLAGPINLYAYSITNLTYGNGPFTGGGAGVTGFNIPDFFGIPSVQWGPNAANDWWEVAPGNSGPGNWEWDIDKDNDSDGGDGNGILQGQTFDSFYIAVPDGTPHGFINGAWVHSWSGGGLLEQSTGSTQIDLVFGIISGPVPEPFTATLLGLGALALLRPRRRS